MTKKYNPHALTRMAQRNVSAEEIDYITAYGQCFHQAGAIFHYLRWRDIPKEDRANARWLRLVGTAVVLTKQGHKLLTVWRNRDDGLKRIQRKPKYFIARKWMKNRFDA